MLPPRYVEAWDGADRRTVYLLELEPQGALPSPPPAGEHDGPCLVSAGRTGTGGYLIVATGTSLRFVVIGAGRLGASLALALSAQGALLQGYTARSQAGRDRAETWLGTPASRDLADLVDLHPDLYIIAVPDLALPEVAAQLSRQLAGTAESQAPARIPHAPAADVHGPVVAHTSGATSVDVLASCEQAGAVTLVFHPLQTFSDPHAGSTRFRGAAVAVTPSPDSPDAPGARFGFAVADLLGARPFFLPDEKRALYHAAAAFACNYMVTLEHHAERLFVASGLPRDDALSLFLPLVRATLDNIAAQGTSAALTGPLSRGDTDTIARHLEALGRYAPHLLPVYRSLGLATLEVVRAQDEIEPAVVDELASMLKPAHDPEE